MFSVVIARLIAFSGVALITAVICLVIRLIDGTLSAATVVIVYLIITVARMLIESKHLQLDKKTNKEPKC